MSGLALGLRTRVSAVFALGALGVSLLLAGTTYAITSNYLLDERYGSALRQTAFDARVVAGALATDRPAVAQLLAGLARRGGETTFPALVVDRTWYDAELPGGHLALPVSFREAVVEGRAVTQRLETEAGLMLAVGIPVEPQAEGRWAPAAYVELFDLDEIDRTLTALIVIFLGTGTATALLGLMLGRWASQRTLRPLRRIASAAGAVARGDLSTRLDASQDPDLAELAAAFNDTTARLQARVDRDARFAGNVSHELRSPLTTIVNAVELVADRREELPEETREVVELLADEVHRMAAMVEDLLEISRPDAAGAARRERLVPATLVPLVADRLAGRPVTVVERGAEGLACVGDKRRLERVIANLVDNAERHGGGTREVRVERGADLIRIAVEDQGPGIPEEARTAVFERFSRGDGRGGGRGSDGVGLGLALVMEHVHAQSGRVWVEPRPGGGARFVVELPLVP